MVIVLTGIELFADRYLKDTWEKLGGHHAAMVKHASVHLDDLWTLAEITQRLYLRHVVYRGLPAAARLRKEGQSTGLVRAEALSLPCCLLQNKNSRVFRPGHPKLSTR